VRHKADLASLICRTRSDQTVVLKQKSRVELGLKCYSTNAIFRWYAMKPIAGKELIFKIDLYLQ